MNIHVHFVQLFSGAPARGLSAAAAPPGVEKEDDKHTKSANQNMLVISGGEGYIDFRIGEEISFSCLNLAVEEVIFQYNTL